MLHLVGHLLIQTCDARNHEHKKTLSLFNNLFSLRVYIGVKDLLKLHLSFRFACQRRDIFDSKRVCNLVHVYTGLWPSFLKFYIPRSSDSLDIANKIRDKAILILMYILLHYDLQNICVLVYDILQRIILVPWNDNDPSVDLSSQILSPAIL